MVTESGLYNWLNVTNGNIREIITALLWALEGYDVGVTPQRNDGLLNADVIAAASLSPQPSACKGVNVIQVKSRNNGIPQAIDAFAEARELAPSVSQWVVEAPATDSPQYTDELETDVWVRERPTNLLQELADSITTSKYDPTVLLQEYADPFAAGLVTKLSARDVEQLLIEYGAAPYHVDNTPGIWPNESQQNSMTVTLGRDESGNEFRVEPANHAGRRLKSKPVQQKTVDSNGLIPLGHTPFITREMDAVKLTRIRVEIDGW